MKKILYLMLLLCCLASAGCQKKRSGKHRKISLHIGDTTTQRLDGQKIEIKESEERAEATTTDEVETKHSKPASNTATTSGHAETKQAKQALNTSPYPMAPGSHKLNGNADGNMPIVVYIDVSSSGNISGKMAYKEILKKYGDTAGHYMYFTGYFSGNEMILSVDDEKGNHQDWTLSVSDDGSKYKLYGEAYSYTRDKYFSISVTGK